MKESSMGKPQWSGKLAPVKAYSSKLQIHSYSSDGRGASCYDTDKTLPRQVKTWDVVTFRDLK
jgi:hypothetical protein